MLHASRFAGKRTEKFTLALPDDLLESLEKYARRRGKPSRTVAFHIIRNFFLLLDQKDASRRGPVLNHPTQVFLAKALDMAIAFFEDGCYDEVERLEITVPISKGLNALHEFH